VEQSKKKHQNLIDFGAFLVALKQLDFFITQNEAPASKDTGERREL
jgi:hypothetical protein